MHYKEDINLRKQNVGIQPRPGAHLDEVELAVGDARRVFGHALRLPAPRARVANRLRHLRLRLVRPRLLPLQVVLLLYSLTGPRRALSLKLSDTRVYEPEKRTRLGRNRELCTLLQVVPSHMAHIIQGSVPTAPAPPPRWCQHPTRRLETHTRIAREVNTERWVGTVASSDGAVGHCQCPARFSV